MAKRLWKYRDFFIFKMVAVHHLGFSKFQILVAVASQVVCANTHDRTFVPNFIKIGQMVV